MTRIPVYFSLSSKFKIEMIILANCLRLIFKILPTCVVGILCLTIWICQIKFYALILFIWGFLFICDLVICNLNFHLLYGGLNKLPEMNVRTHRM
jgi:hypothetical protein